MSDKRIPKPGEVWVDRSNGLARTVVNVYPDAVTYRVFDEESPNAKTLDQFMACSAPPEPTVVRSEPVFYSADDGFLILQPGTAQFGPYAYVGTIAAMSDGTFRFEAAS